VMLGTLRDGFARAVRIRVLDEVTLSFYRKLLTIRTVLGQPHLGKSSFIKARSGDQPGAHFWRVQQKTGSQGANAYLFSACFQPPRQSAQSSLIAASIAFAALCNQRPRRAARSLFTLLRASGLAKCMLAVSQPMQ
jgi:hypothetical protein